MVVNPGRARNELVPEGSARMVPWKRKSERDSFLRSVRAVGSSPARAGSPSLASTSIPSNSLGPTPAPTLDALYALPPSISFHRRTTGPTTTSIHGSLSLADIQLRLQDDYGLSASDVGKTKPMVMSDYGNWAALTVPCGSGVADKSRLLL